MSSATVWNAAAISDEERTAMDTIVNCICYANGKRVGPLEIDEISHNLKQPGQFIWIGLYEPSEELLKEVQQQFGLHDLAIEDAHNAHQRPKAELYGDSLFVVLRTAHMNAEDHQIEFGETHVFLGARYIVTVRHDESLSYAPVRARVETTPHLLGKGPGFALYALMDFIVDQYFPIVDALEAELHILERKIFGVAFSRDPAAQIYHLQGELLAIKRVVSPLIEVCNRLMRFDLTLISDDTQPYFRDVYDHAIRVNEMIDTLREMLTTALEANFSLMSIAQNDVMKSFAGWGAIFALPTMVAGIYGMNFEFMPELHLSFAYPLVMIVTLGLCAALYLRFRRAGWL
jgi:magnesium transporter